MFDKFNAVFLSFNKTGIIVDQYGPKLNIPLNL